MQCESQHSGCDDDADDEDELRDLASVPGSIGTSTTSESLEGLRDLPALLFTRSTSSISDEELRWREREECPEFLPREGLFPDGVPSAGIAMIKQIRITTLGFIFSPGHLRYEAGVTSQLLAGSLK